jgi:hypothetical protein
MNRNGNKRKKITDNKSNKLVRCSLTKNLVFKHKFCSQFKIKTDTDEQKNCKN